MRSTLTTVRGSLTAEQAKVASQQRQVTTAQAAATDATARAQARASAHYAGQLAGLRQQQQTVAGQASRGPCRIRCERC